MMGWGINWSSSVVDNREADDQEGSKSRRVRLEVFAEVEVPHFNRRAEAALSPPSPLAP